MATTKEVKVIINGEEFVSKAAKEAEGGLAGFVNSAKGMLASLGAVAAGLALGQFFKTAIEEAQNSREAMGQLALAVNNSGASFAKMSPQIDATIDKLAKMTKFGDDDFARAMQQMTVKTGDADWAMNNLSQAANLAAASNTDLSEAADILSKAHEGNTKSLFALIPELKGASNWQEMLAQKTDGAAEAQMRQLGPIEAIKKQFGEFAESVGKAILGNDEFSTSGFGVADMLADLGKWVEANRGAIGQFIDVVVTITKNLIEGFWPILQTVFNAMAIVGVPVFKAIVAILSEVSFAFRAGGIFVEEYAGKYYEVIGGLIEKGGKVLKAFGINVVEGFGTSIRQMGEKLDAAASEKWTKLESDHKEFWGRMKNTGDAATATIESQEKQRTRVVKESLDDQKAYWDAYKASLATLMTQLKEEMEQYKLRIKTLNPAVREAFETTQLSAFNTSLQTVKKAADDAFAAIKQHNTLPPLSNQHTPTLKATSDQLVTAARATLDWGDTFGVLDDKTKSALNSVINLAAALPKALAGDFTSIAGVIGAVGSLVQGVTAGDAERRNLLRENNTRLAKLRDGIDGLSLNVTGNDFGAAGAALASIVPQLKSGKFSEQTNLPALINGLAAQGLTLPKLEEIGKQLGISLRDSKGNFQFAALPQLLEAIQSTKLGAVGQSFGDQFAFFKDTQRITGATGTGALQGTADFVSNVGGASVLSGIDFSDPAKARAALFNIFTRLNNGGLSASELGRLSPSQFYDILLSMIDGIDNLGSGAPSVGTGSPSTGTGDASTGDGGSITPVPSGAIPKTIGDIFDQHEAFAASMAEYHTSSLGYFARITDATERTADGMDTLVSLVSASASRSNLDDAFGRALTMQRRLGGDVTL